MNQVFISEKTAFFIVTAVRTSSLTAEQQIVKKNLEVETQTKDIPQNGCSLKSRCCEINA
jgi:hypothetical protein